MGKMFAAIFLCKSIYYLLIQLFYVGMPVVRTDGWA